MLECDAQRSHPAHRYAGDKRALASLGHVVTGAHPGEQIPHDERLPLLRSVTVVHVEGPSGGGHHRHGRWHEARLDARFKCFGHTSHGGARTTAAVQLDDQRIRLRPLGVVSGWQVDGDIHRPRNVLRFNLEVDDPALKRLRSGRKQDGDHSEQSRQQLHGEHQA